MADLMDKPHAVDRSFSTDGIENAAHRKEEDSKVERDTSTQQPSASPTIPPIPSLSACPPLSRSFSAASTSEYASSVGSSASPPSAITRSSSAPVRPQRGYVRTQGVAFAPSAGNRDSVLSLGSITHLQYYFARTGLLDGKGAQLAKDDRGKPGMGKAFATVRRQGLEPSVHVMTDGSTQDEDLSEGVIYEDDEPVTAGADEMMMLPPTVSTYAHRSMHIAPPPDAKTLKQDLLKALEDSTNALQSVAQQVTHQPDEFAVFTMANSDSMGGWHQIQGLHVLDVVTLAIRAAKIYYTSHDNSSRLYTIKSERQLREDLLMVMDVLKRMAGRNFAGGIKMEELRAISIWVDGIGDLLVSERRIEQTELEEQRQKFAWMSDETAENGQSVWQGRERERERFFLSCFMPAATEDLPQGWAAPTQDEVSPFIASLRTGLTLVHLHNNLLKQSRRQFGEISTYHTDLAKPYRCAENLRYWIKGAEIRYETRLTGLDVSGIVHGNIEALKGLDDAVLRWSKVVREDLSQELWRGDRSAS